ncbi:Secreted RxLR effector peptide protein [Phytophthora palmivora]|uniref:RxLR effector protein n=1 Tax=Phytophthora palmivora TaxID=4796 RepID=A0A2P4X464_9STRA|nr:Secreted RxLR effector peptide protein [Phytophthora palmivora]
MMRLSCVILVAAVTVLSNCDVVSTNLINVSTARKMDLVQSVDTVQTDSDNRYLRIYDTDTNEEERAFNWSKLFDFKKWFGKTVKKNEVSDFAQQNIANMLVDPRFKKKMFKQWNLYTMNEITTKIGDKTLRFPTVQKLMNEYRLVRKTSK